MFEAPAPTEVEVDRARAVVEIASKDVACRALEEAVARPFDLEADRLDDAVGVDDDREVVIIRARAEREAEEVVEANRQLFLERLKTPDDAGWAARTIVRVRDRLDEVKRWCRAAIEQADKRVRWSERMLWPAIEAYASTARRDTKKGWKFDGTTVRLAMRSARAALEITDPAAALAWVKDAVPFEAREDGGIVRVREEVSAPALLAHLEEEFAAAHAARDAADAAEAAIEALDREAPGPNSPMARQADHDQAVHHAREERDRLEAAARAHRLDPRRTPFMRYVPAGDKLTLYRK